MDVSRAREVCEQLLGTVSSCVVADDAFLERVLTAVLARGHVLIEDVSGTGKTLTARSFPSTLGLSFSRIQFTPDLLPADITGTHVYRESDGTFAFTEGQVVANFVLADEINRTPPKNAGPTAGGDGRTAGDRRRGHVRVAGAVRRRRDTEPDRLPADGTIGSSRSHRPV